MGTIIMGLVCCLVVLTAAFALGVAAGKARAGRLYDDELTDEEQREAEERERRAEQWDNLMNYRGTKR